MNGRSQRQRPRNNDPRDYGIAFAHMRIATRKFVGDCNTVTFARALLVVPTIFYV